MKTIACGVLLYCCSSCIHQKAYFGSPVNAMNNSYRTIPLQSDSLKTAFYAGAAFSDASTNDWGHDYCYSFQTNFSASHNFKNIQAYYGASVLLGSYKMNSYFPEGNDPSVNGQILNQYAGKISFGAVGFNGGLDVVVPIRGGGEWRLIGIETSVYKEFGDYLTVRKQLPDSAATFIARKNCFATIGGYTEIADKTKYGSFGIKCSLGTILEKEYHNVEGIGDYAYFSFALAPTIRKWTPYVQANLATKASGVLLGLNYRIGK